MTVVLGLVVPPLAIVSWILLSGSGRASYFESRWIRWSLWLLVLSAVPLLIVVLANTAGVWPDPNPNPIGFGLLFFAGGIVATVLALVGVLQVAMPPSTKDRPDAAKPV